MRKFAWFIVLCLISTAASAGQSSPEAAKEEVRKALSEFITAFDNLDWEHFRAAFVDDATVFYPREFPNRASGRTEIERNFRHVFEVIRAGRTKPPYMDIQPRDLEIQMMGDLSIVTFHLDDRPPMVNRRTIVLRKTSAGWKIAHLHASEVAMVNHRPKPLP